MDGAAAVTAWEPAGSNIRADLETARRLIAEAPPGYQLPEYVCPYCNRAVCVGAPALRTHVHAEHPAADAALTAAGWPPP